MADRPPSLDELMASLPPPRPPAPVPGQPAGAAEPAPHLSTPPGHRGWGKRSRATPDLPCMNCGDPTLGWYCPTCGQRKADVRISLRRMLREVMDDQLSLNSTLPRTLGTLFFAPGRLTREYVQGHIVRYIPPFRLYLVSSLLFFVALSFVANPGEISVQAAGGANEDSVRTARIADSVLLAHARAKGEDTVTLAKAVQLSRQRASNAIQFGPDTTNVIPLLKPVVRRFDAVEARLNAMPRREAVRTMIESFEENAPIGVFVMMPLFALILQLLYVRRKRFYVEHFVFALHTHAFAFLTGTIIMVSPWDAPTVVLSLWLMIYLFIALKRVYGQGYFRTFFKYVALGVCYSFLLIFGVTATMLMTAFSL